MQELLLQIIAMLKEIRDLLHDLRTLILSQQQRGRSS
jgi:hypothetical protein